MNTVKKYISKELHNRRKGRWIDVYDNDVFIVSYPKSGNTWMRFLVGGLIYGNFSFSNIEKLIPDIYINNNGKLAKFERPRILKSHEYFDPRYKKVIYIVRDPRSVAVSYYHFHIKTNIIPPQYPFADYLDRFVNGKLDKFGSWEENVISWICNKIRNPEEFLLVRYEDLKEDTFKEFKKIVGFLGLEFDDLSLQNAISDSSFETMKKDEELNKDSALFFKNSKKDLPFVRRASVIEWKEYFDEKNHNLMKQKFGNTMKEFNY